MKSFRHWMQVGAVIAVVIVSASFIELAFAAKSESTVRNSEVGCCPPWETSCDCDSHYN